MARLIDRVRIVACVGLTTIGAAACNEDKVLGVDLVGTITAATVNTPAAADAVRIGAMAAFNAITATSVGISNTDTPWLYTDVLTDVWQASDANSTTTSWDQRTVPNTDIHLIAIYNMLHVTRTRAADAIRALKAYKPTPAWGIGQMYWAMAVAEMELGEYFCNGVPLSTSSSAGVVYGVPLTSQQVLAVASAHLDTASSFLTATDTTTVSLSNAVKVTKARVLVDLGQWASAIVLTAGVPTSYAYQEMFNISTGDNIVWQGNRNTAAGATRTPLGDSVAQLNGGTTVYTIANAIPFASGGDPRVPSVGSTLGTSSVGKGNDTRTNAVFQGLWVSRTDPIIVVSGLDARLIEAESKLQGGDYAGMVSMLNTLRAAPPRLSTNLQPAAMAALPVPSTKDAATSLYFREKAYWTFGRGQRLGDLRRLVRQYGRSAEQVYPSGTYYKTGTPYGTDVVLEIPPGESTNPNVTANGTSYCVDKNP